MATSAVLFCGLPGSGKSSTARRVAEALLSESHSVVLIDYDEIEESVLATRTSVDDDEAPRNAWNQARRIAVERLKQAVDPSTRKLIGKDDNGVATTVILDDNFHLRGMRKQIHRLLLDRCGAPETNPGDPPPVRYGTVWMDVPYDVCLRRNRSRQGTQRIPQHVMQKMRDTFQPPDAYWESDCKRATACTPVDEIVDYVLHCPPIVPVDTGPSDEELQKERSKTYRNTMHQIDQCLRKFVGVIAKSDRSYARLANSAKDKVRRLLKEDAELARSLDTEPNQRQWLVQHFLRAMEEDRGSDVRNDETFSNFENLLSNA